MIYYTTAKVFQALLGLKKNLGWNCQLVDETRIMDMWYVLLLYFLFNMWMNVEIWNTTITFYITTLALYKKCWRERFQQVRWRLFPYPTKKFLCVRFNELEEEHFPTMTPTIDSSKAFLLLSIDILHYFSWGFYNDN